MPLSGFVWPEFGKLLSSRQEAILHLLGCFRHYGWINRCLCQVAFGLHLVNCGLLGKKLFCKCWIVLSVMTRLVDTFIKSRLACIWLTAAFSVRSYSASAGLF